MKKQHYLKNWSQKHSRHGQLRIPASFPCAAAREHQSLQGHVLPTSSEYKNGVRDLNIPPWGVKVKITPQIKELAESGTPSVIHNPNPVFLSHSTGIMRRLMFTAEQLCLPMVLVNIPACRSDPSCPCVVQPEISYLKRLLPGFTSKDLMTVPLKFISRRDIGWFKDPSILILTVEFAGFG